MGRVSGVKEIGILLLSLVLLVGLTTPMVVNASGEPMAKLLGDRDSYLEVGSGQENLSLDVNISDCPTFYGMKLRVIYNEEALTLKAINRGPATTSEEGNFTGNHAQGVFMLNATKEDPENQTFSMTASDGVLFTLVFDVTGDAKTGSYDIRVSKEEFWDPFEADIPIHIGDNNDGIVGTISVTGELGVCEYNNMQYDTVREAVEAITQSGSPGTIVMNQDTIINDIDERIIIPADADVTLDMNGKTITSGLPTGNYSLNGVLIMVEKDGKLNIVDESTAKGGKFVYDTPGTAWSIFLANAGTLNMSDIIAEDFDAGVVSGSWQTLMSNDGTFGEIRDCIISTGESTNGTAFGFRQANVGEITGCTITSKYPIDIGYTTPRVGKINLIEGCELYATAATAQSTPLNINGGIVETVKDCTFEAIGDYAISIKNGGRIGSLINSAVEAKKAAININKGNIDLIGGEDTLIIQSGSITSYFGCLYLNGNEALVGTISGGTFEGNRNAIKLLAGATIENITDGYFQSDNLAAIDLVNGSIEEISGGTFTGAEAGLQNAADGTIGEISGGEFICDGGSRSGLSNKGTIEVITGGEFVGSGEGGFGLKNESPGVIETITGGIFSGELNGLNNSLATIESITGGEFYGDIEAGLNNLMGTIGSISDSPSGQPCPRFRVSGSHELAFLNVVPAETTTLAGGYYKNVDNENWIDDLDNCEIALGYGFCTQPMREDVMGEEGYYHFGELVEITWVVEGENEQTDYFVKGDPIYYNYEEPAKEPDENGSYTFSGWNDGTNTYAADELPEAATGATYTAVFGIITSEDDYEVGLVTGKKHINAGEEFAVDVKITSKNNDTFFGSTLGVIYDDSTVDLISIDYTDGFGKYALGQGGDGVLEITGAYLGQGAGFEMDENQEFKVATLTFKAKSDIAPTGMAVFTVQDDPIINQEDAVTSQIVAIGDPLSVNLWNISVNFAAGEGVTMTPATAYVKYNEPGLYIANDYEVEFEEPQYTAQTGYTLHDPVWKPMEGANVAFNTIKSIAFKDNATYTATAFPGTQAVTFENFPGSIAYIAGVEEGQATYLTDIEFKIDTDQGYRINRVYYAINDGAEEVLSKGEGDKYTIPGTAITGSITVHVDAVIDGTVGFVSNDDFCALPDGYKLLVLTVDGNNMLASGKYAFNGKAMFHSGLYGEKAEAGKKVYLYIVADDLYEGDADEAINDKTIYEGTTACIELAYDGNVNLDARIDSTDVVLAYGLYRGIHQNDPFTKVNMQMRLEADFDGDKQVDITDAQKILNKIWGIEDIE